jgi:large subunit ribosomal protein L15
LIKDEEGSMTAWRSSVGCLYENGYAQKLNLCLGKRILFLQGTFALLHSPISTATQTAIPDPHGRTPFEHPALEGLPNLTSIPISEVLTKQRLGQLATSYGIAEVTRWKPRNVSIRSGLMMHHMDMLTTSFQPMNLDGSGRDVVYTASLYAILGALALQKGGEFANHIARDRVLKPLGI